MCVTNLILATTNAHKIKEVREILSDFPVALKSLRDFSPDFQVDETGKTYEENALIKAVAAAKAFGLPALADDSGLEVDALGGELGVYSSRYLGEATDYTVKNAHILKQLENVPEEKRIARYVCAAALAYPDGSSQVVRETVEGLIALEPHGAQGFGYDPIFWLPLLKKTMAELSSNEKNEISHRGKAFRQLMESVSPLSF